MTARQSSHRLSGLEPDNLLAFMALLGLLRALDEARPQWRARAFWEAEQGCLRPALSCTAPISEADITEATAEGINTLAPSFNFSGRRDLNHEPAEASAIWREIEDSAGDSSVIELFAALLPDGGYARDKLHPTPLCFLFGQGHQHFLDRLADIPNARVSPRGPRHQRVLEFADPERIGNALFHRWRRADPTDGFRWDPAEDRRYALRAGDPSGDPAGQEFGACRLAAIGLLALPGRLVRRGAEARYLNAMSRYDKRGIVFEWPIWTRPARLASITAMLSVGTSVSGQNLLMTYRAHRISVGKFFNVSAATPTG